MKLKKSIFVITIFILTSCAQTYRGESIESKMARFEAKYQKNIVPNLPLMKTNVRAIRGRFPASNKRKEDRAYFDYSNRRLYFTILLSQYDKLRGSFKETFPSINICPRFHTAMTNYNEKKRGSSEMDLHMAEKPEVVSQVIQDKNVLPLFPELSLPVTKDEERPVVLDLLKNLAANEQSSTIKKGLKVHVEKMRGELNELCEHGDSNNYYVFENLVTLFNKGEVRKNEESDLEALSKTTIFSNLTLINALSTETGRNIASDRAELNPAEEEALTRLQIGWAKNYLQELKKRRSTVNN